MQETKSTSIADVIFDKIEEKILDGTFAPGDSITELKLSEMLDVSRTPVREAMSRLRHEGLIEESGKGAVVVGINRDDLIDIYEVRARIEGLASARLAGHITREQLKELDDVLSLQEFYTEKGDPEGIKKLDSQFHHLIYTYCGSRTLSALLDELHRKVQRFRRVSVENPSRAKAAAKEHREIYEALKKGDSALTEELAVKHIRNAQKNILKGLERS